MRIKQILAMGVISAIMAGSLFAASAHAQGVDCAILPADICRAADAEELESSGIWLLIIWIINILTVGVGIAAVGAIAFAGFLYATARDDSGQTKKAIEMIRNTMIGLLVYIFMYAAIQYLIPGGVFGIADGVLANGGNHAA